MSIVLIGTNIRTWREREIYIYMYNILMIYIYTIIYVCVWIFFRWGQVWCTHSRIWLDNHSWYKQSGNVSCFLSLDLIAQARLARRSLCLWLHSFWFLNVPQKYIAFPLTALQKFRSWCFSPKLNLSRELCELWCRRCRAIRANPKSQCMGLSLICSGYPMSGSKGPHHGPIFIIDTHIVYTCDTCVIQQLDVGRIQESIEDSPEDYGLRAVLAPAYTAQRL